MTKPALSKGELRAQLEAATMPPRDPNDNDDEEEEEDEDEDDEDKEEEDEDENREPAVIRERTRTNK